MPVFLIDARFLLRHATESFWGAPLILVDGNDHTFCFGFLRDLLRLRSALHVHAGVVVIASDASSVAAEKDIRSVVTFCGELGVIINDEPGIPTLAAVSAHANRFSDIITDDQRMLQFCSETCAVHLVKDSRSIARMTAVEVRRSLGVPVPFEEMKEHACSDADAALQLYGFLEKELRNRMIDRQFEDRTMALSRALLNMERDGVPVDRDRLEQLRSRLVDNMHDLKKRVSGSLGTEVDLESHDELSHLIRNKLGFQEMLAGRPITQNVLEQLAPRRPAVKWIVQYKRCAKQVTRLEAIIRAIRDERVYPVFSQTRDDSGYVSSTDPDLFGDDGLIGLQACIGGIAANWLRDPTRSLDGLQRASGDRVLEQDRQGPCRNNLFMTSQASMSDLDHDGLLLRVASGESSHRLSSRFLVDRLTISEIFHVLSTRYESAFRYLAEAISEGSKRGYVERQGVRRYFDGFGSSSIEKRNAAKVLARRWILDY